MSISMKGGLAYRNFEAYYPNIYNQVVDHYVSGPMEITITLEDGSIMRYDDFNRSLGYVNYTRDDITQDEWLQLFGSRLRKIMYIQNVTQQELSKMAGVSNHSISNYINGLSEPGVFTLFKICTALDCNISDLVEV